MLRIILDRNLRDEEIEYLRERLQIKKMWMNYETKQLLIETQKTWIIDKIYKELNMTNPNPSANANQALNQNQAQPAQDDANLMTALKSLFSLQLHPITERCNAIEESIAKIKNEVLSDNTQLKAENLGLKKQIGECNNELIRIKNILKGI